LRCQALARRNDLHIDLVQNIALRTDQLLVLTAIGFRILVQLD
jgi:hypothetical protein